MSLKCLVVMGLAFLPAGWAAAEADAHAVNRALGRGINLGNMLDAPTEGAWGQVLEASYFDAIAKAGFDSVRVPVRWSAHADAEPPYTIDPVFFDRVQWAVDQAVSRKLAVVLNVHHYHEVMEHPAEHAPRLLAIWDQVARRFADYPETVVFELLNEPMAELDAKAWNVMIPGLVAIVRQSNPKRVLMVGPPRWNGIGALPELVVPEGERGRMIVTVHYYSPFEFTHQGASWVSHADADAWLGTTWAGTDEQQAAVRADLDAAASWAEAQGVPIYVGEYGALDTADMDSRARWTRFVTAEAAARGFSTAYWEFSAGFGAYDPGARRWRAPLREALLGE